MVAVKASRLTRLVRRLRKFYGHPDPPPLHDPYLLLLWEQVAYLGSDADRLAAFRMLEATVGTAPERILSAKVTLLRAVTRRGGAIGVPARAERLRAVARRVLDKWEGNLRPVLRLPLDDARRELARYPAIGPAGAERILLLCGAYPVFGLESNALRVLLRLGYGKDHRQWNKSYESAQRAAGKELPASVSARRNAYLQLRRHGQTLCRRSAPRCDECPLQSECPTGRAMVTKGVGGPALTD